MAQRVREAMDDPEGQVQQFLEALSLSDSAANRMLAMEYLGRGLPEYARLWKRSESDDLTEAFNDPDQLEKVYETLDDIHENDLAEQKKSDDITYSDVVSLAKMAGSISFYQKLRSHQTYEVPLVTEEGVTACHVTIQSGEGKKGMVEITVESDRLGRIQAAFRVNGSHVRGFVTVEMADRIELCQNILTGFEKDLEENGFTMDSESLIQGSRRSLHKAHDDHADRAGGAKNKDLYQVAKCFLVNVKGKITGKEDET